MNRCTLRQLMLLLFGLALVGLVVFPMGQSLFLETAVADDDGDDDDDDEVVFVSGGGTATFDDFEGETQFGVGAIVQEDGTAQGQFICAILGDFIIVGEVAQGTVHGDGSVTLAGVGHGVELGEPFAGCDFSVTFRQGGPGGGGFVYTDCVVGPDAETVSSGLIVIGDDD